MEQKRSRKAFHTIPFVWNKTLWAMTFMVFGLWFGLSGFFLYKVFEINTNNYKYCIRHSGSFYVISCKMYILPFIC